MSVILGDCRMSEPKDKLYLLVINNQSFFETLKDAVERLKKKTSRQVEFGKLEIQHISLDLTNLKTALQKDLLKGAFLCFCNLDIQISVADFLKEKDYKIPLFILLPRFTTENIDKIYEHSYLYTRGFFHQDTQDPETIGQIIKIVKEEFRRKSGLDGNLQAKSIGWLVERSSGTQIYASLFLDTKMRDFMQQLLFIVESIYTKSMPKPIKDLSTEFRRLCEPIDKEVKNYAQINEENGKEAERLFSKKNTDFLKPQPILLEGETGVGKTLIAKRIHKQLEILNGGRTIPFQHISTVNVGRNIIEPELFGVIKGAWTDSVTRPGKLLMGRGGVIFLDEIGELPPEIQAKFLIYMDSFEFQPDGWNYEWKIWSPIYILAATNIDLKKAVDKGQFRRDLYHRFTHKLSVPALRERRADIRALIDVVLQNKDLNNGVKEITIGALSRLENYNFSGNFRELETVLSKAVFRARQAGRAILQEDDLEF